jgi:hypothetical protein
MSTPVLKIIYKVPRLVNLYLVPLPVSVPVLITDLIFFSYVIKSVSAFLNREPCLYFRAGYSGEAAAISATEIQSGC